MNIQKIKEYHISDLRSCGRRNADRYIEAVVKIKQREAIENNIQNVRYTDFYESLIYHMKFDKFGTPFKFHPNEKYRLGNSKN